MLHPFRVGTSYDREQILDFLGSRQWQSGIVYGKKEPSIVSVFSGGRHGARAGYTDRWNSDGSFSYCGQGTRGDQRIGGANQVLLDHYRTVLLFETWRPRSSWKGKNRFVGEFLVAGHHFEPGQGDRAGDRLIVVTLVPARGLATKTRYPKGRHPDRGHLRVLRAQAMSASQETPSKVVSAREYWARSDVVASYALARSHGRCEHCGLPAPFLTRDGTPYLEVHHTQRLADDGPDDIFHVAALRPNCHREAHYGPDHGGFRLKLESALELKEQAGFDDTS